MSPRRAVPAFVRNLVVGGLAGLSFVACALEQPGAAAARPPTEPGMHRKPDLVEVATLDSSIRLDVRYATRNNFVGEAVYRQARAFLQRPAAEALVRAHRALAAEGFGIVVFDGYRPWSVTKRFWEVTPVDKKQFVANPAWGSKHNRGCAVDCSLYELASGREVEMPSQYDETTERSAASYTGGSADARARRDLLRASLEAEGYAVYEAEWWHYDYRDWREYPILDVPFEDLGSAEASGR